jgi:hypothetical protein
VSFTLTFASLAGCIASGVLFGQVATDAVRWAVDTLRKRHVHRAMLRACEADLARVNAQWNAAQSALGQSQQGAQYANQGLANQQFLAQVAGKVNRG